MSNRAGECYTVNHSGGKCKIQEKFILITGGHVKVDGKKTGIFAAGVLFGTAGIKALSSKDAKKLYTNCTAAVLRAKKVVMDTVTTIQENAEDIYADAKQINEEREAAEEAVEDVAEETAEEAVEAEAEDTVEA